MIRRVLKAITEDEGVATTEEMEAALRSRGWIPDPEDRRIRQRYFNNLGRNTHYTTWIGPYENMSIVITERQRRNHEWVFDGASISVDLTDEISSMLPAMQQEVLKTTDWRPYSYAYTVKGLLHGISSLAKKHKLKYRGKQS